MSHISICSWDRLSAASRLGVCFCLFVLLFDFSSLSENHKGSETGWRICSCMLKEVDVYVSLKEKISITTCCAFLFVCVTFKRLFFTSRPIGARQSKKAQTYFFKIGLIQFLYVASD